MNSPSPYPNQEGTGPYRTDKDGDPVSQPLTYEERVELARKTVAEEPISSQVLVDEMDNAVWCTYGPMPNIAYLIGTNGKIITKQNWYEPEEMEAAIQEYLNSQ